MGKKIYARRRASRYYFFAVFIVTLLACIFYLMGFFFKTYMLFIFLGAILAIILIEGLTIILNSLILKHQTWGQGATGEEIVARYLKEKLDSENLVINDVKLQNNVGNIDHIVIGKHGIFVIETKKITGNIFCDGDNWTHENFHTDGTRYVDGEFGSPSKQAKANANELYKFLKEKYPQFPIGWVDAVVVFVGKNTNLTITNNPTNCIIKESPSELIKYIKEQKSKIHISGEDLYTLKNLFEDVPKKSV